VRGHVGAEGADIETRGEETDAGFSVTGEILGFYGQWRLDELDTPCCPLRARRDDDARWYGMCLRSVCRWYEKKRDRSGNGDTCRRSECDAKSRAVIRRLQANAVRGSAATEMFDLVLPPSRFGSQTLRELLTALDELSAAITASDVPACHRTDGTA
jgi:hypothetical protein